MTDGGSPHSEILGSKPGWRLPEAYRGLLRLSSALCAKASTKRPGRTNNHPSMLNSISLDNKSSR